jgi:hypothetical protein
VSFRWLTEGEGLLVPVALVAPADVSAAEGVALRRVAVLPGEHPAAAAPSAAICSSRRRLKGM